MLFNSIEFLLFLPLVFILYWYVFKSLRLQNIFIITASYIFYGWWDWHFLLLIAFTSLCSYLTGIFVEYDQKNNSGKYSLACTIANITVNLLILCIYKYYNFFVESFVSAFSFVGIIFHIETLSLILPVGISFYTFQALSYSIDVYRKKILPTTDILSFFAFLSFFPQLVAGPIERASNLLPQFQKNREFNYTKAVDGMRQILLGFVKKIVIADNCAVACNQIFDNYSNLGSVALIWGALMFTFQIYGDFSGYSDIAIGTARLFGISLKKNFNYPYLSRNVAEFWKRWHISLNTWFVDYIYIPLGGSRCSKLKTIRNTFVIFLASGLWHGANWTFICWGLYHALLFVPLLVLGRSKKVSGVVAESSILPSVQEIVQICSTFFLVMLGWIIFRAEHISDAIAYILRMFTNLHQVDYAFTSLPGAVNFIYVMALLVLEFIQRKKEHALQLDNFAVSRPIRWVIYYALIVLIVKAGGEGQTFIYFQF